MIANLPRLRQPKLGASSLPWQSETKTIEEKPWDLEQVVEMTADYVRRKEDAVFEAAFAEL